MFDQEGRWGEFGEPALEPAVASAVLGDLSLLMLCTAVKSCFISCYGHLCHSNLTLHFCAGAAPPGAVLLVFKVIQGREVSKHTPGRDADADLYTCVSEFDNGGRERADVTRHSDRTRLKYTTLTL